MKYFKKMSGDKLYLSPIDVEDVEIYTKWINDPDIAIMLGKFHHNFSKLAESEVLEKLAKLHNYAIIIEEKDEIIGSIGLGDIDHLNQCCEIGLFVGKKELWRKGYGQEAVQLLLEYAFHVLNMQNIMLRVHEKNRSAIELYKKLGFNVIGKRRDSLQHFGTRYNTIYMDLLIVDFVTLYMTESKIFGATEESYESMNRR